MRASVRTVTLAGEGSIAGRLCHDYFERTLSSSSGVQELNH
jgi:hypothetical protein